MLEDLYKIKIIRDFLRLFSEHKWKSLITNVLQLGILHLKTHHQLNNLSLDEIIDILGIITYFTKKNKEISMYE